MGEKLIAESHGIKAPRAISVVLIVLGGVWLFCCQMFGVDGAINDLADHYIVPEWNFIYFLISYIGIIPIIMGIVINNKYHRSFIIITDRRAIGRMSSGKQLDIPIDKISAISTTGGGGINISSSSGTMKFRGIANNEELREIIRKLIVPNSNFEGTTFPAHEMSVADEIMKYKAFLDQGIITVDEFEAKKKQILGL